VNVKDKFPKTVKLKTFLVSLTLVSVIFLASIAYVVSNGGFSAPNIYLDDLPSTASYTVKTDDTYFWAVRYDGKIPTGMSGTNDDLVIQYAINNCTSSGGSVLVKSGSYTASVTLKDNVTLILDKGAKGITVSIDSGADGTLVDYQNGIRKEWVAGVLYTFMDLRTGKLWWQGSNRTDTLAYPEQTASYIVFQDGSLTKMKNGTTGQIDASSTVDSDTIQWAIGNCSGVYEQSVYLKGNFTLTSSIVPKNYTTILIDGDLWAGANITMISYSSATDYLCNVAVVGVGAFGVLHGNDPLYIANGLNITDAQNGQYWRLENLMFQNFGGFGMYLKYGEVITVTNIRMADIDGTGIFFWCPDSKVDGIVLSGVGGTAFVAYYSGTSSFSNFYLGGASYVESQLHIQGCRGTEWDNIRVDHVEISEGLGVYMDGSSNNTFVNFYITYPLYNNMYALQMESSSWNRWTNLYIDKSIAYPNLMWKYGILESDGSDYNIYSGKIGVGCQYPTYGFGANSKLVATWNGTTWVP